MAAILPPRSHFAHRTRVCGHRGLRRGVSARRGMRPLPRFPVVDSVGGEGAQYLLPAELADDAVSGALAPRFKLRDGRPRTTERTFYDTFDGRLHAANLVAVHAEGRLALAQADSLTELAAAERPDPPDRIFAAELESERLRELLERLVEVRALLPIARTHSRVRRLGVLDAHAKTVVRLTLEEPVARSGRSRVALRPRLIVAPVRGYDRALDRVRSALEGRLGLAPAQQPLHDEAVAAAGGRPGGVRTKLELTLDPRRARRPRGRRRPRAAGRRDRDERRRRGGRPRQRVPARSPRRRAPHTLGPAPASRRLPTRAAGALPRGVPLAAAGHRPGARPRRPAARVRRPALGTGAGARRRGRAAARRARGAPPGSHTSVRRARCARGGRAACSRAGRRSSRDSASSPRTTARMPPTRSASSPPTASARSTAGW